MNKDKGMPIAITYTTVLLSTIPGITFYALKMSSKQNSWLVFLISIVTGLAFILMTLSIRNYSDKTIFEINKMALGKIFGTIVNFIFCLVFMLFSAIISWQLYVFFKSQFLSETPFYIIGLILLIPLILIISKSNETFLKTNIICFPIIFVLCLIAFLGLSSQITFDNLKPFEEVTYDKIIYGVFAYFSLTILPTYSITGVNKCTHKKRITLWALIGILMTAAISILTYLVLGKNLVSVLSFPEMYVLRKIGNLTSSARVDSFLTAEWVLSLFITLSCHLLFIRNCLKNTIKSYNNKFSVIIPIIMFIISLEIFDNIGIGKKFILNLLPYICFGTLFVLNLIIFIILKFKKKPDKVSS